MARRGPTSSTGRQAVRLNALKHGILSHCPVVPGVETEEDWNSYQEGVLEDLRPKGALEVVFAKNIASLLWRRSGSRFTRYVALRLLPESGAMEDDEVALTDPRDSLGTMQNPLTAIGKYQALDDTDEVPPAIVRIVLGAIKDEAKRRGIGITQNSSIESQDGVITARQIREQITVMAARFSMVLTPC